MISRLEQFSTMKVLVVDDQRANVDLLLASFWAKGSSASQARPTPDESRHYYP